MAFQSTGFQIDAFQQFEEEVAFAVWVPDGPTFASWASELQIDAGWDLALPTSNSWSKANKLTDDWVDDLPTDGNWNS
jgi:hypothetical protein